MGILTVEHPFFELLRSEHRQIESYLKLLLQNENNKNYANWLWENAELTHHFKEETILFNCLAENRFVNSGGPLCMFFIDQYILFPPLEKCKKICGKIPELETHQKKIFELGLTMQVPINEHRSGKEILKHTLNNWDEISATVRFENLRVYCEIQKEHLNKEENCFFHLCVNLLKPEDADDLLFRWNQTVIYRPGR